MRIDHGDGDVAVSEQFLHRADVLTRLRQMRCETVTQHILHAPLLVIANILRRVP